METYYKEIIMFMVHIQIITNQTICTFFLSLKFKPKILCKLPKLFANRPILVGYQIICTTSISFTEHMSDNKKFIRSFKL